ncbi:MAG: tRNA dihydrouridine synthase DusB [Spirochaetaceae bacterium]
MTDTRPLYQSLRVGEVTLPGNIFLAPLAGYTDKAFREICREHGAPLCYTEMVSAEAVARGNSKSLALMERGEGEEYLGIQLFLSTPEQAERCLEAVLSYAPTLIDINCGCPVPKVVKTGAGAALMRSPETIYRIVSRFASSTDTPVTVKIRSGWDSRSITYKEAACAAQEGGAEAIGLHARTREQGYSGTADWEHISDLASTCRIPVIGSGDLFSAEDVHRMLTHTGCRGVMCARGAIGNPSIFSRARRLLSSRRELWSAAGGENTALTRIETALRHYKKALYYRGERVAVREMKKHFAAYTKGLKNGSSLRDALMRCNDGDCYRRLCREYLAEHGDYQPPSID